MGAHQATAGAYPGLPIGVAQCTGCRGEVCCAEEGDEKTVDEPGRVVGSGLVVPARPVVSIYRGEQHELKQRGVPDFSEAVRQRNPMPPGVRPKLGGSRVTAKILEPDAVVRQLVVSQPVLARSLEHQGKLWRPRDAAAAAVAAGTASASASGAASGTAAASAAAKAAASAAGGAAAGRMGSSEENKCKSEATQAASLPMVEQASEESAWELGPERFSRTHI